ncbi:DinB family protein [Metabacillus litoralis]|uniref:DinB family protein n=1 Tax=Metabacillus litoralis TaxID=152268 RepID=UPI001CFE994B|nr:DinB family protein [Metabacillus litoralis]
MNNHVKSVLHQIEFALKTLMLIMDELENVDLIKRPTGNKQSVGELLEHIVKICEADVMIANSAKEHEMISYYSSNSYKNIEEMRTAMKNNFNKLERYYLNLSEKELTEKATSYWGVTYTKFEWLLEILVHIYHHRGQLHAILTHCCGKNIKIPLFE